MPSPTEIASFVLQLNHRKVVINCQKGKKISQGSIAILGSLGVDAESAEGGHFGWRDENSESHETTSKHSWCCA